MSFTPQALATAIGGRCACRVVSTSASLSTLTIGRVVIDSRQVQAGDVFWALRGDRQDGANFIGDAFRRGASGVVTSDRSVQPPDDRWVITVHDTSVAGTSVALTRAARWQREQFRGTVVAVTGSVGKTTTRQMIDAVLRQKLTGTASLRNHNNHVGLPMSMLAWRTDHDYAVVELGASAAGEIASLADICRPNVGVVTRLGDAHLGTFGSREAVANAKAELLDALPSDGLAVMCADDPRANEIAARSRAPIVWIGESNAADIRATEVHSTDGIVAFTVDGDRYSVPVWGRHHLDGALAAVAIGRHFGLSRSEIADGLASFRASELRCQVVRWRGATIINDCYNSSPVAVRAALELLQNIEARGTRIALLGDMCDLGVESAELHRRIGEEAVTVGGASLVIACGRYANEIVEGARSSASKTSVSKTPASKIKTLACDVETAIEFVEHRMVEGDVMLVKGSRAMALERVVETLEGIETQHPALPTFVVDNEPRRGKRVGLPHQKTLRALVELGNKNGDTHQTIGKPRRRCSGLRDL